MFKYLQLKLLLDPQNPQPQDNQKLEIFPPQEHCEQINEI